MMALIPAFIGGWALLICAGSLMPLFVMGRIVTGACGGMFCVLAPMYSAEISEKQIRGISYQAINLRQLNGRSEKEPIMILYKFI